MSNPYRNQAGAIQRLSEIEARNMRIITTLNNIIKALVVGLLLFIILTWSIYFGVRML